VFNVNLEFHFVNIYICQCQCYILLQLLDCAFIFRAIHWLVINNSLHPFSKALGCWSLSQCLIGKSQLLHTQNAPVKT